MTAPVMAGAEPFSATGDEHGVLVLHGFTGNPQSMRGLATAFADAGFTVELPLLPGHGTAIEDMLATGWDDWSGAAELAFTELASRCSGVIVAGLSMGGMLDCWLAAHHPEVVALVAINPAVEPPGEAFFDVMRQTLAAGIGVAPAIGNDVADPEQREMAYDGLPVAPLITLLEAQADLAPRLSEIVCPTLVITSRNDHVVPPVNSDFLAAQVSGPVERVWLERSFHVATLDYERDELESQAVSFARKSVLAG